MNIEKIEKLLGALAKKGDKETLKLVADLLLEISSFEKKSESTKNIVEDVLEEQIIDSVDDMNKYSHAATILDGLSDSPYDRRTPRVNYSSGNSQIATSMNSDMLSHADMLI